jgi:secreted trypsin-like serine protease
VDNQAKNLSILTIAYKFSVTSVCNGDSGGGMVFKNNNKWFLRGLVSVSVALQNKLRCDPNEYAVFTDVAKFLPWIGSHM